MSVLQNVFRFKNVFYLSLFLHLQLEPWKEVNQSMQYWALFAFSNWSWYGKGIKIIINMYEYICRLVMYSACYGRPGGNTRADPEDAKL